MSRDDGAPASTQASSPRQGETPSAAEPKPKKLRVSRRALIVGAAGGVITVGAEYASFRGVFDHRRGVGASASERYAASLRQLEGASAKPGVVHVGHSTHLISAGGLRLLTDPWFYDPAFGALSHEVVPAVLPSGVGKLDAILITHDHADHADLRAMDEMDKTAVVFVSTNELAARVRARGFGDVVVLAPWGERKLGSEVVITAVPAQHDIYEINYVIKTKTECVYFAGDTRLHPDIPAIAERFAPSVAILPVDGTRLTGGALHVMTPDDAVKATGMLGPNLKLVMPSHAEAYFSDPIAGTFLASMVPRARFRFAELMSQIPATKIACKVPEPGELVAF